MTSTRSKHLLRSAAAVALLLAGIASSEAAITFSVDAQGPTGLAPALGGPGLVSDGDILTPAPPGLLPPPTVVIPAAAGGLGILAPGLLGNREVDALSYGRDVLLTPNTDAKYFFSVDEFAIGAPAGPVPSVTTEGAAGAAEASADIYRSAALGSNTGFRDGNGGLSPFPAPGLNLLEPNPPTAAIAGGPPSLPDFGDNLDALDIDTRFGPNLGTFPVYFSMDTFLPDPLEGPPVNTGTAVANGFSGADVVTTKVPGGPPMLFAPAPVLGLQLQEDDLDALILNDVNGDGLYDPVTGPYSWLGPDKTDMLIYSVRRGSFAIGMPDAITGAPIEEGDLLVPVMTGPGTFVPGIFVPAEALGLATVRSGTGTSYGLINPAYGVDRWADDLDGADVVPEPGSAALVLLATCGFILRRRRR